MRFSILNLLIPLYLISESHFILAQDATFDGDIISIPAMGINKKFFSIELTLDQDSSPPEYELTSFSKRSDITQFIGASTFEGSTLYIPQIDLGDDFYALELRLVNLSPPILRETAKRTVTAPVNLSYTLYLGEEIPNRNTEHPADAFGNSEFLELEGMIAADVTGDGKDELIIAPGYIFQESNPDLELPIRIFQADESYLVTDVTNDLIVGEIPTSGWVNSPILVDDFNEDLYQDIFLIDHGVEYPISNNDEFPGHRNILLLSNGDGTLYDASYTHLPDHLAYNHAGSAGDFDSDGDVDVVISGFNEYREQHYPLLNTYIFLNDGEGIFTFADELIPDYESHIQFTAFSDPSAGTNFMTDLDGDGFTDIIFPSYVGQEGFTTGQTVRIYFGLGGGLFDDPIVINRPSGVYEGLGFGANQAIAEDLDSNGLKDILIKLENEGEGFWYLQQESPRIFKNKNLRSFGSRGVFGLGHDLGSADTFYLYPFNLDDSPDIYIRYGKFLNNNPDNGDPFLATSMQKNILINNGEGVFLLPENVEITNQELLTLWSDSQLIPANINDDDVTDFFVIEINVEGTKQQIHALIGN